MSCRFPMNPNGPHGSHAARPPKGSHLHKDASHFQRCAIHSARNASTHQHAACQRKGLASNRKLFASY